MKTLLTMAFILLAGIASAQTITCMPMGQSMACYNGQGGSTIITPMSPGLYSYGNSNGQMGTIYTPPTPQPVQPMPYYAPPSQSQTQPMGRLNNPYQRQYGR